MGECILRYDHYCPWVANAIGYYNYKFFVLFVLYGWLSCVWVSLGFTPMMITHHNLGGAKVDITWGASMAWVLALSFGVSLTLFGALHLYFVYTANTSVEANFKRSTNTFDRGNRNNFALVFGSVPRLWFVPVCTLDCALATAGGTYAYAHTIADVWAAAASARAAARLPPIQGEGASHLWAVQRAPHASTSAEMSSASQEECTGLLAAADDAPPGGDLEAGDAQHERDSDDSEVHSAHAAGTSAPHLQHTSAEPAPVPEQAVQHANQLLWHHPGQVSFDHKWWWWTACKFNPGVFVINTSSAGPAVPRALRRQFRGGAPAPIIPEFVHPRIWQRVASRKNANAGAAVVAIGSSREEQTRASLRGGAPRGQLGSVRAPRDKVSRAALRGIVPSGNHARASTLAGHGVPPPPTETKAARGGAQRPSGRGGPGSSLQAGPQLRTAADNGMGFAPDQQME